MTLGVEEFADRHIHKIAEPKVVDPEAIGNVFHDMMLRGMSRDKMCRLIPESALSKSGSRAGSAWQEFKDECETDGVIPMLPKHWNALAGMERAFLDNESARKALEKAERREASCEWKDDETGLVCRVMFDIYHPAYRADIKTTKHILQPFTVANHIAKIGYHWQVAFYEMAAEQLGAKPGKFHFVFQRIEPQFKTRFFSINPEQIQLARAQIRSAMHKIANRLVKDDWLDDDHGKNTELTLPRWIENLDRWQLQMEDETHG
jgi:hypothetical protein